MIQDKMITEIQEMKLSGFMLQETYDLLKSRHTKVLTIKTVRKCYNMDATPDDNHVKVKSPCFRYRTIQISHPRGDGQQSRMHHELSSRCLNREVCRKWRI